MKVTNRDLELLRFLAAQGAATAQQLIARLFPTDNSFRIRIGILRRQGLVEAVPVSRLRKISVQAFERASGVLAVSRRDLWKYKIYRLGPRFEKKWSDLDLLSGPTLWKHQLRLNEIRTVCEGLFPGALFLSDPDIRQEWRKFKAPGFTVIPDLEVRTQNVTLAVEVERTLKTEAEYFDRFLAYRGLRYTHVIYFCENDRIFNRVVHLSARQKKIGVANLLKPRLIFQNDFGWVSIEEFLGLKATP